MMAADTHRGWCQTVIPALGPRLRCHHSLSSFVAVTTNIVRITKLIADKVTTKIIGMFIISLVPLTLLVPGRWRHRRHAPGDNGQE
jgi:hypothetical protein